MTFKKGNLLEADVEALVNTVNTVGVMGKGIALMFKERFPDNFDAYVAACREDKVRIGEMFVTENREFDGPRWIAIRGQALHAGSRLDDGLDPRLRVASRNGVAGDG